MESVYSDIIERMRSATKLKNDSAVAKALDVTPQALSNYKKRGKMPTALVVKFSSIYGLSVDWLLTGKGSMALPGSQLTAAEECAKYGEGLPDMSGLNADEIIYVGKLLKVLRNAGKPTVVAVKCSIDAFLKSVEPKPSGGGQ